MATESQQRRSTATAAAENTDPGTTPAAAEVEDGVGRMSATVAAGIGLSSIIELTGKEPEGVIAVEPTVDGWIIAVEVVEDRRVPSSADVLATYEAELDSEGTLLACRRTRRYSRGRGDGGRRQRA